jgi:predicted MFS family arabinose efflux permease
LSRAASGTEHSANYVWYAIGLLTLVNAVNYMDRMALSVLLPFIKADLQLSDGHLGLLVGFAFSVFYAICGVPIALWADRGVRRNIIAVALALWSAMTALCGAAQNLWQLFLARMGVGVGEAGSMPPSQSMICDYVPFERRAGVFALHTSGVFIGMMVGMAVAGRLGETIGWRLAFVALGLPGVVLALLVRLTLREPVRGRLDAHSGTGNSSLPATVAFLWRCRTYRLLTVYGVSNGFVQYGFNQWWPSFYARVHEFDMSRVGASLGLALGIGSSAGLLIGGLLANHAARRNVRLPLVLGSAAISLTVPTTLLSLFVPTADHSILLVALTAVFWNVATGPIAAALYSVVLPGMRATAGAISILFVSVLGFSLGPFCVGLLSDLLATSWGTQALRYALLAPVCALPIMVGALYLAAQRLPNDLRTANV